MSAVPGVLVPDVVTSVQTWTLADGDDALRLLDRLLSAAYPGIRPECADRIDECEWSGAGVYRLQVRLNRPEGKPLFSLKWEGPP